MRTQFRSLGARDGTMFYAAELTVGAGSFGRIAISAPAAEGRIDIVWYDVRRYETAAHILQHVKGRGLIEGRAKSSAFAGGQLVGVEPDEIQRVIGRGEVVVPAVDTQTHDADATLEPT